MRLLIIGDLEGQIGAATKIARSRGAKVTQVLDIDSALASLRGGSGADLVMIEARSDVSRLVSSLQNERIAVPVIACGVQHDSQAAVKAIKAGAKEYLPLPPQEELIAAVLQAITEESHTLLFASPRMAQVLTMADQVAPSDASVLITGESGTGKEVVARYMHRKSKRADKPFISVNCAAIPENLLESELFGHEKGAFTGAIARRIGKFEEANGGTLLLDEISEMDVRLQAKLLRAIQEREIDRVGGTKPVKVDIRILATSNRDLQASVKAGVFREDLLYRLNVIQLELPPLRDRLEDIAPIATHFIEKYAQANGVALRPLAADALAKLQGYGWPGNVRELENTIHRAVLMATGSEISATAILLPGAANAPVIATPAPATQQTAAPEAAGGAPRASRNDLVGRSLDSVEKDLILDTLNYCLGNRTHAANILGISIRTLRNKLKQYGDMGEFVPPHSESAPRTGTAGE
jgi:two-component system response regulator FlrC